jgi:hypothetical protein
MAYLLLHLKYVMFKKLVLNFGIKIERERERERERVKDPR